MKHAWLSLFISTSLPQIIDIDYNLRSLGITVDIDYNLQFGIMDLFSYFFSDPMLGMQILNHGCWCSKLHPMAVFTMLGGPYHSDEVDDICKEWQKTRRCSRRNGQICENMTLIGTEYQVIFVTSSIDARCVDSDDCLSLTCQIDLFYVNQLLNATQQNFNPELNPTCEMSTKIAGVPVCEEFQTTEIPTTVPTTEPVTTLVSPIVLLCQQHPMDLMFVLDGSGSVGIDNFNKQILFMKEVTSLMTFGTNDTRFGLVQYSDVQQLEFGFIDDASSLQTAFDNVVYLTGGTRTGTAIQYAYDNVIQPTARSNIRVAMVVLTDGFSFDDVVVPSDFMRSVGIDMFSVGYFGANTVQLQNMANDPDSEFVYQGATIDDLLDIVDDLVEAICSQGASYQG